MGPRRLGQSTHQSHFGKNSIENVKYFIVECALQFLPTSILIRPSSRQHGWGILAWTRQKGGGQRT